MRSYRDRTDLAGLAAAQLTATRDHPLPAPLVAAILATDQMTPPGRALLAAVTADPLDIETLAAELAEIIETYPAETRPLRHLSRLRATSSLRHKNVWDHTLAVVANCVEPDPILRLAALCHDIGKPSTRALDPVRGVIFDDHELVGAAITTRFLASLGYAPALTEAVALLVRYHLRPHRAEDFSDAAIRRYVFDATPDLVSRLNRLSEADVTSKYADRRRAVAERIDLLRARISEVVAADTRRALRPPINGHDVASYLGIAPGPELGRYMKALNTAASEAVAAGRSLSSDEAWAIVDSLKPSE